MIWPGPGEHSISQIRRKYDEITKQLLQADSVPGLDQKMLLAFKRTYGLSVLICRFGNCPRGVHGFETSQERDEHEMTHLLNLRCPHLECVYNRIGLRSAQKLKQHLEESHPEEDGVKVPSSIRPFNESKTLTGATLVGSPEPGACLNYGSDELNSRDDQDEKEDIIHRYGLDVLSDADLLALRTAHWS